MTLLGKLFADFGTYAAIAAVFAAIVSYRANPIRAVNRFFSAHLLTVAAWQLAVALARTTHDVRLWSPIAGVIGAFFTVAIYMLHDACVRPNRRFVARLSGSRVMWLILVHFAICYRLAVVENVHPGLYPFWYRVAAVLGVIAGCFELRNQTRNGREISRQEVAMFECAASHMTLALAVFALIRTPAGSRINTALTLVYLGYVILLLLSGRVLDVSGTARIAFGTVIRMLIHFTLVASILFLYKATGGTLRQSGFLVAAVILAVLSIPIWKTADRILQLVLRPFAPKAAIEARNAAMAAATKGEDEAAVLEQIATIAKAYLQGIGVRFVAVPAKTQAATMSEAQRLLFDVTEPPWLSPDLAARRFRGVQLDRILASFAEGRLGAVVKASGHKVQLMMLVEVRAGGSKPIRPQELDLLHELASFACAAIDRIRAVEENLRARALALAGRVAADFSHNTKNQIAAIEAFVHAVCSGEVARLSPEHRAAVHREIQALAKSQNIALELAHARPSGAHSVEVLPVVASVVMAYERVIERVHGRFQFEASRDERLFARCDDAPLRQVLVNLVRNSIQAAVGAGREPVIIFRLSRGVQSVHIDVVDNGPGVPAEIHDRLFTAWATTKTDGTGLGLAFCQETMRAMGGSIHYMMPRGADHAWFRLALPLASEPAAPKELAPVFV